MSSLALAQTLHSAGHDVQFAAPSTCAPDIEYAGFEQLDIEAPQLSIRSTYLAAPANRWSMELRKTRAREAAKLIANDGMATALTEAQPDLVLADCEHHSAILQTVASDIRLATLSFMYFTQPTVKRPPLTHATVPGRGFAGSFSARWAGHQCFTSRKRLSRMTAAWKGWGADLSSAHRQLAQELGVDLKRITRTDMFQSPWSYTIPNLLLVEESLDLPGPIAKNQKFLGSMVLHERRPREKTELTGQYFDASPDKIRIYAGFGSMRSPPIGFVKALFEVARQRPDWCFLIASSMPELSMVGDRPDNVTCASWVPQLEALERADCTLFHGGAGTLNECLATATPMIVYPNALDGRGNGARVYYHGLGCLGRYTDGSDQITKNIKSVLSDNQMHTRLEEVKNQISQRWKGNHTAKAIEALLS